jgi:hypothetical protein
MTITNEDLRQNPPIVYVQLRDLDGTIISLSAPFIKEPPIQVTIEIVSPERAMKSLHQPRLRYSARDKPFRRTQWIYGDLGPTQYCIS